MLLTHTAIHKSVQESVDRMRIVPPGRFGHACNGGHHTRALDEGDDAETGCSDA